MAKQRPNSRTKSSIADVISSDVDMCFVGMPFSKRFDPVYQELIEPVILDAGMRPVRSDMISSGSDNIRSEITLLIQRSRIVLFDITESNPNVLLELGMALALNKTVIVISQDEDYPTDVKPHRVNRYDMSGQGKRNLKKELFSIIRSAVFPTYLTLRSMLFHGSGHRTYVLYGRVDDSHVKTVHPPPDSGYSDRLSESSSETAGISQLAVAYQKIASGLGEEPTRFITTDAHRAPPNILARGNVFILGGPGANPFFSIFTGELAKTYEKPLSIKATKAGEDAKRWRIYRGPNVFPPDQDDLLAKNVDVGMLIRAPNPFLQGSYVWLAAGVRSYGTEGAIRCLVTPSLINILRKTIDIQKPVCAFWMVVKVPFDPKTQSVIDVAVYDSSELVNR